MVSKMGIIDSYEVQILPFIGNAMSLFLFYQFFTKIPKDLIDAAKVDGVSLFKTYLYIGLPISKPVIATVAILQFLEFWNSYLWPKVIMTDNKSITMPMMVANLVEGYVTDYGVLMLGVLLCTIPTVIIFFILQKSFAEGITGAVK